MGFKRIDRFIIIILLFFLFFLVYLLIMNDKEDSRVELDDSIVFMKPNLSYLNLSFHASRLISNFNCSREHLRLLIVVTSNVSSAYRRNTIRMTWGRSLKQHQTNEFRTYFVVGKIDDQDTMNKLEKESKQHNDIIIGDYNEHFYNLSYKFETIFEWAYKYCSYDYLLKTDDDVFVNLPLVMDLLGHAKTPKNKVYLGLRHHHPRVARSGKYSVTYEEYAAKTYPDYCGGGAVIFSNDVVKNVIPYFQKSPFKLDDVYVGMLVYNSGCEPILNECFDLLDESCSFKNNSLATHSTLHTRNRNCILKLYYSMLANSVDNLFARTHYIDAKLS